MSRQFWDVDNCQTCEKLEAENAKLRAELIQCREQLREQSKSFCTHCGTFFPSGKEGIERFREHIAECNSHPLNSMARELVSLRVDIERLQSLAESTAHFIYWSGWLDARDVEEVKIVLRDGSTIQCGTRTFGLLREALDKACPDWRTWNENYRSEVGE